MTCPSDPIIFCKKFACACPTLVRSSRSQLRGLLGGAPIRIGRRLALRRSGILRRSGCGPFGPSAPSIKVSARKISDREILEPSTRYLTFLKIQMKTQRLSRFAHQCFVEPLQSLSANAFFGNSADLLRLSL